MKLRHLRPGRRAAWLSLVPLLLACDFVADRFAEPAETPEPAATVVTEAATADLFQLRIAQRLGNSTPALQQHADAVWTTSGPGSCFIVDFCKTKGDNCHGTTLSHSVGLILRL